VKANAVLARAVESSLASFQADVLPGAKFISSQKGRCDASIRRTFKAESPWQLWWMM